MLDESLALKALMKLKLIICARRGIRAGPLFFHRDGKSQRPARAAWLRHRAQHRLLLIRCI
jgi:hypothetical protein